ncbi:hypothetical protein [Deinococcus kurensis]|uniref:hypothetical protein n=1 Tax=Deinococcus kurensis TaxID=2662757 RepID=UPI0012D3096C|nr:hypothetical protein [Deinococcus kurensis]
MAAPRRKTAIKDDQPEKPVTPEPVAVTAYLVNPFTIQYGDFTYKRAISLKPGSFLRCTSDESNYSYEGAIVLIIDEDNARVVARENTYGHCSLDDGIDPGDIKEEPQYWEPVTDEDALAAMRKGNS